MTLRPNKSPLQWVSVTHPPEVKRPEHRAAHPLRSSDEVKTGVAVYLSPLHAFTSVYLERILSLSVSLSPSSSLKVCSNLQFLSPLVLSFFQSPRIFVSSCRWSGQPCGCRDYPKGWIFWGVRGQHPARVKILFNTASRPSLGFTGPLIQWQQKATSIEVKPTGVWSYLLASI